MNYRVMIHPSGDLEKAIGNQLYIIAQQIYNCKTEKVIFRVKTVGIKNNC